MTNQHQNLQNSASIIPTATTDQPQTLPYSILDEGFSQASSSTKDKEKARNYETTSNNSGLVTDSCSNLTGSIEQTNLDADDSFHHQQNIITNEIIPDVRLLTPPPHARQQLPNEVLSLIINHLPHHQQQETLFECALVTKQFHAIANPLLWQVINFYKKISSERFLACLSDAPQERLATLGHHIRDLRLCGRHWTDAQLTRLLPHLPLLKRLAIHSYTYITDTSFQHLPYHCQQLTSLQLGMTGLTQVSFSAIGQHCHQLCHLQWNVSGNQSPEWLALLTPCPLAHLHISSLDIPLNERQ